MSDLKEPKQFVKLSPEALAQFPDMAGSVGQITRVHTEPGLVRVKWHNRRSVQEWSVDLLMPAGEDTSTAQPWRSAVAVANERIRGERQLIRQAFDLIRYDPARADDVALLARTLGGRNRSAPIGQYKPYSDEILAFARSILAEAPHE